MADQTVAFELVAPDRLLRSEPVEMVVVPGEEGDFGVLPGHAPFMSMVRPGLIGIYENDKLREQIFVAGGFAEVTPARCTVLAEEAVPVAEIERAAVERRLKTAEEAIEDADDDAGRAHGEAQKATAQAMLEALDQAE